MNAWPNTINSHRTRELCFFFLTVCVCIAAFWFSAHRKHQEIISALDHCDLPDLLLSTNARQTIAKSGTNCLPLIVSLLKCKDSVFKRTILLGQRMLPDKLLWFQPEAQKHKLALSGLSVLGSKAGPAIPEIEPLLNIRATAPLAANALCRIGPATLAAFENATTNADPFVRAVVAGGFAELGTNAVSAIPSLIVLARDVNSNVRARAALALGLVGEHSEKVVSLLIEKLSDTEPTVRAMSALSLANFGDAAERAIEPLIRAASDSSFEVRNEATIALGVINNGVRRNISQ